MSKKTKAAWSAFRAEIDEMRKDSAPVQSKNRPSKKARRTNWNEHRSNQASGWVDHWRSI